MESKGSMTELITLDEPEQEERTYDLDQEETLFVHMEDGKVAYVVVISDTSGWCSCEKDHDGPIDYHIEQSWDHEEDGDPHGHFVIEGCTGTYIQGDGWTTDDDADFHMGKVRPATQEEIDEHA